MSVKRKRLGRGLDALLSASATPAQLEQRDTRGEHELRSIAVELLQRGQYQPRVDMRAESLEELAESIRAQGVVQPIVVRTLKVSHGAARYEIIAGERRWRAAQMAGLHEIPAIVHEVDDEAAVAISLIENIQRENLNPLEEARALERLIAEFDMTHQEAADAVGRSRAAVSNLLRLLELEPGVSEMVQRRDLEMGHARALLALEGRRQLEAAQRVKRAGLSVRETERLVRQLNNPRQTRQAPSRDPDVQRLEGELGERLGAQVRIEHGARGKGRLTVSYNSLEELEGILAHIK